MIENTYTKLSHKLHAQLLSQMGLGLVLHELCTKGRRHTCKVQFSFPCGVFWLQQLWIAISQQLVPVRREFHTYVSSNQMTQNRVLCHSSID